MTLVRGDPRGLLTRLRCKVRRRERREESNQLVNDSVGSLRSTEQVYSGGSIHSRELERELLPCDPIVCHWQGRYIEFRTKATLSPGRQGNKCAPTCHKINNSSHMCSSIECASLELKGGTPWSSDCEDESERGNNSYTIRLRGASLSSYYRAIKEKPQGRQIE